MWSSATQIPVESFQVTSAVPAGSKARFHLVAGTLPGGQPMIIPALVARGREEGPTLLATGGVHGDEYEGPVAIQDCFEGLDVASMRGTFFGIPVLNGPAFTSATRESGVDHENLARIFPGSATGTLSHRIAHAFHKYLVGQADLYLDMHSAGNLYAIHPLAGYQVRPGDLGRVQREAAIAFGLDLVWGTAPLPGRTLSTAGDRGVPAIYVELRGEGRCMPEQRRLAGEGILNTLGYLGVIERPFPVEPPRYCFEQVEGESGHLQLDHPSPASGLFLPAVEVWEQVEAGQPLGVIRHVDGTVLARVQSSRSGRVLMLRTLPRVFAGDFLAYVLELPGEGEQPRAGDA